MIEQLIVINDKIQKLMLLKYSSLKTKNNKIKLDEFCSFQEGPGIRNWQYVTENGVKFINIRCINNNDLSLDTANMISKEEAYGIYKHFLINENDILVSTSGTLGRIAIARRKHLPLCMNTSVIRFKPKELDNYSFLYCYLISDDFKEKINSLANGSAQLNFGPTHIKQIYINIPDKQSLKCFNDYVKPLIDIHIENLNKIDKLKKAKELYLKKFFG